MTRRERDGLIREIADILADWRPADEWYTWLVAELQNNLEKRKKEEKKCTTTTTMR